MEKNKSQVKKGCNSLLCFQWIRKNGICVDARCGDKNNKGEIALCEHCEPFKESSYARDGEFDYPNNLLNSIKEVSSHSSTH